MKESLNIVPTQVGGGRNVSLDFIKGVCIILMIIGHTISSDCIFRHVIYSFHMPLFFIVGGYNIKCRFNVLKDIKALLVPYALLIFTLHRHDLLDYLSAFFWGNCGHHHVAKVFNDVPVVGALWFLPAYIVAKNMYTCLCRMSRIHIFIPVLFFSTIGLLLDHLIYLPFAINQGLSAILFFYIGHNKKILNLPTIGLIICVLLWIVGLYLCDLNMAFCRVNIFYPIAVLGIIGIYVLLYKMARRRELSQLINAFSMIGKNSMALYCIHVAIMFTVYHIYGNLNILVLRIGMNILFPIVTLYVYKKTIIFYGKVKTRYLGS